MELHGEPPERLSAMQHSMEQGLAGAEVISAVLESRQDDLWLRFVGADGRVVDLRLTGAQAGPHED